MAASSPASPEPSPGPPGPSPNPSGPSPSPTETRFVLRRGLIGGALTAVDGDAVIAAARWKRGFRVRLGLRLEPPPGAGSDARPQEVSAEVRTVGALSPIFDVTDADGAKLGALQRRGVRSLLRGEWWILDADGQQIGRAVEAQWWLALLRRVLEPLGAWPRRWRVELGAQQGTLQERLGSPGTTMEASLPPALDLRLALSLAALLLEGGEERD